MTTFRWGIFGTGAISAKFVAGLRSAQDAEVAFVASRTQSAADAFARGAKIPRAVVGYAAAAELGGVDAVYIATPPSEHAAHALLCLEAGLPVLVEKPFAMSAPDAERVLALARARGLFAMEAMWTRFLPAAQAMHSRLRSEEVGQVRVLSGSFGSSQVPDLTTSIFDPALGGGALSHLAPYPLSLAQWFLGTPTSVQALGTVGPTGVDETVALQLRYPDDVVGSFLVSVRAWAPDDLRALGTHGSLSFRGSIVRPHGLEISHEEPVGAEGAGFGARARLRQHRVVHALAQRAGRSGRAGLRRQHERYAGNGYHYEADETRACVTGGVLESPTMPWADTLAVASTIDTARAAVHAAHQEGRG